MEKIVRKNYYLFWLANFITHLGTGASFIIIGKYSYDKFNIASIFGGILLLEFLFGVILAGKAGSLVDNNDTKKIAYISDFILFIFGALFSYFAFIDHMEITIIGFSIVLYLLKPFQNTSLFALTKELANEESLFKFNSHLGVAYQFGYLLGILSAGVMVNIVSPGYVFLLDALTFLVSGVLIYFCSPISKQTIQQKVIIKSTSILKSLKKDYNKFLELLKVNQNIVVLSCVIAFQINVIIAYNTSLFKLVSDRAGDSFDLSLFESSYTIASILLSFFAGHFAILRLKLNKVWIVFIIQVLILSTFAVESLYSYLVVSSALFGLSSSLIFPASITKLQEITPSKLLGLAGASKNIIRSFIAIPVVSLNAIILDVLGLSFSYYFLAALNLIMVLILVKYLSVDKLVKAND